MMKRTILIVLVTTFLLVGCNYEQREEALKQKEQELNKREEELEEREKNLKAQEDDFQKMKQRVDSSLNIATKDSGVYNAEVIGTWEVKMNCIETNCAGSAIGDTKVEQWNISYQGNMILCQAIVDEKIVRTYTGIFSNNMLQLEVQQSNAKPPVAKIFVNLRLKSKNNMEGRRIITQSDDCRIVYDLDLDRK